MWVLSFQNFDQVSVSAQVCLTKHAYLVLQAQLPWTWSRTEKQTTSPIAGNKAS